MDNSEQKEKQVERNSEAKVQEMKQWLRSRMQYKVTDTIKLLNIKLVGHYRYYGITDNTEAVRRYWRIVTIMLYKNTEQKDTKEQIQL